MDNSISNNFLPKDFQGLKPVWPYLSPIVATALANIPVYYGFIAKSALQMNEGFPKLTAKELAYETLRSSPTVGLCVGTQIIAQHLFEKKIFHIDAEKASFKEKLLSAVVVGGLSAPIYAAMNAQTMGKTIGYAYKHFTKKQFGAITVREGAFLMGLEMADPLCDRLKDSFPKQTADVLGSVISGLLASIVGHPADTYLTLEQKGMSVKKWSCFFRGGATRAVSVAAFSLCYHKIHEKIEKLI